MYALYSLLSVLALVAASPYFLYQAIRHRKYVGGLRERLGTLPVSFNVDGEASIWIHAVSVGEALTTRALLTELRARYPRLKVFVSTTTMTGYDVARRLADTDGVFYCPFDWTFAVRRTLRIVRPRLFIMVETEIWPNLLRECRQQGVATVLVNGRISSRSFARYKLVRGVLPSRPGNIDRCCMQSEAAARRIIALGADPARVKVTGSLKFDSLDWPGIGPHGQSRDRVLRFFSRIPEARPVVMAASTLRGEDRAAVEAFRRVQARWPQALLILAPRHPERFDEVAKLVADEGLRVERRTALTVDSAPKADVVVLDTIGELARLYQIATVVFVGGSLVDAGGHNILEPAVFGRPIVFGPHMRNFAEIAAEFLRNDAALQVHSTRELADTLVTLVGDPVQRARLGAAARAIVESNRGANARTLDVVSDLAATPLPGRRSRQRPAFPGRAVNAPGAILSSLYTRLGSARRRLYGRAGVSSRLERPVISVGNVAVGGRGKTPVVARIATLLVESGERPAILSRGYGRRDPAPGVVVVSDGTHILADLDRAGDEPLMLARALDGCRRLRLARPVLGGQPRRTAVRRVGAPARRRLSARGTREGRRPGPRRSGRRGRPPAAVGPAARAAGHTVAGRCHHRSGRVAARGA